MSAKKYVGLIMMFFLFSTEVIAESTDSKLTARFLVVAEKDARMSSQMNGRIKVVNAKIGKSFKRKQVLIEFDCAKQKAELDKATAEAQLARKFLEAQEELLALDAISDMDLENSRAENAKAIAEKSIAKAVVSDCKITAPFDGRVAEIVVKQFENVSYGDPLIQIVKSKPLQLDLLLPSSWIVWLKTGIKFTVVIDETGLSYESKITGLGSLVDSVSKTIRVRAVMVDPDDKVLPGMSGIASFVK